MDGSGITEYLERRNVHDGYSVAKKKEWQPEPCPVLRAVLEMPSRRANHDAYALGHANTYVSRLHSRIKSHDILELADGCC